MATKKKRPKKKAAKRARPVRPGMAEVLAQLELVRHAVIYSAHQFDRRSFSQMTEIIAQREAIERLDLAVAKALSEAARMQPIDPTLYPGPQDGGVPDKVATLDNTMDRHKLYKEPEVANLESSSDAELLS